MNNKGFAITSVIYGLAILGIMLVLILMSTLSSSRNNVKDEAERAEKFLLAVNQTEVTFRESGRYTVPKDETGLYRIEAFGQKDCSGGANGAYATGVVYLEEGTKLTINIGNCSNNVNTSVYMNTGEGRDIELIRVGRGIGNSPGGTQVKYKAELKGSKVSLTDFSLASDNYTGMNDSNYELTGDNTSYMRGYPVFCDSSLCDYGIALMDGLMLAGASSLNSGKVIIERLAHDSEVTEDSIRQNNKFDSVKSIRVTSNSVIDKIYVLYHHADGNYFKNMNVKVLTCSDESRNCTVTLERFEHYNIDDVNITFKNSDDTPSYSDNINNIDVKFIHYDGTVSNIYGNNPGFNYGIPNNTTGIHLSAYQPDTYSGDYREDDFTLHGNFYIFPITSYNKVLSASSSSTLDSNILYMEGMTGEARQKWAIDLISSAVVGATYANVTNETNVKEYRIMELARYKALSLYYDDNFPLNNVVASNSFNTISRNNPQIWNIHVWPDSTYVIKTSVPSLYNDNKSGFLVGLNDVSEGDSRDHINEIVVGKATDATFDENTSPTATERFFFYSLDFSR